MSHEHENEAQSIVLDEVRESDSAPSPSDNPPVNNPTQCQAASQPVKAIPVKPTPCQAGSQPDKPITDNPPLSQARSHIDNTIGVRFHIPTLPKFLSNKRAIINIKKCNHKCFGYAVLAGLHPEQPKSHRTQFFISTNHPAELNQFHYPVGMSDIPQIEDQLSVSINVFGFRDKEGKERFPLYVSNMKFDKQIDVLMWNNHYVWISSFQRFMRDLCGNKCYWCKKCLHHFRSQNAYEQHIQQCSTFAPVGQLIGQHKERKRQSVRPQAGEPKRQREDQRSQEQLTEAPTSIGSSIPCISPSSAPCTIHLVYFHL